MTTEKKVAPVIIDGGLWVEISPYNMKLERVSGSVSVLTEWRGRKVRANFAVSRYTHSAGLSEWRAYAGDTGTGYVDDDTTRYSHNPITDLARARITEESGPMVIEWLESERGREAMERALIDSMFKLLESSYLRGDEVEKFYAAHGALIGYEGMDLVQRFYAARVECEKIREERSRWSSNKSA